MVHLTGNFSSICPSCEFTRGARIVGKEFDAGSYVCPSCGGKWRDIEKDSATQIESNQPRNTKCGSKAQQSLSGLELFTTCSKPREERSNHQNEPSVLTRPMWFSSMIASIVLCVVIGLSLIGDEVTSRDRAESPVRLSDIELVRQKNAVGGQVFSVRGRVDNLSGAPQPAPRISITVYQSNGFEIANWVHNAPVNLVGANATVRFVSSIQHDNPFAAYADAKFVQ